MIVVGGESQYANSDLCDPVLIGGVGGSGTRVVCKILIKIGFHMANEFNKAYDTKGFSPLYRRWIRPYLDPKSLNPSAKQLMKQVFLNCLSAHLKRKPDNNVKWGYKNPKNVILISFLHEIFPKMKFILVVRDGRDMAFSKNLSQVKKFGDLVCKNSTPNTPLYSLEFWSRINLKALDYGLCKLKSNFLLIRFEDLIGEPSKTIKQILDFTNTDFENFSSLLNLIRNPKTIGRWKDRKEELGDIPQTIKSALEKFHYF